MESAVCEALPELRNFHPEQRRLQFALRLLCCRVSGCLGVGPGSNCSPRHRMPFNLWSKGAQCMWMLWRAIVTCAWLTFPATSQMPCNSRLGFKCVSIMWRATYARPRLGSLCCSGRGVGGLSGGGGAAFSGSRGAFSRSSLAFSSGQRGFTGRGAFKRCAYGGCACGAFKRCASGPSGKRQPGGLKRGFGCLRAVIGRPLARRRCLQRRGVHRRRRRRRRVPRTIQRRMSRFVRARPAFASRAAALGRRARAFVRGAGHGIVAQVEFESKI